MRVVTLPLVLYLTTFPLGILTLYVSATQDDTNLFSGATRRFALAYTSLVISFNLLVSTLICTRILFLAKRVKATLGKDAASVYTNTAALLVKSALPYTLFGVAYVATLGTNSPVSVLFLSLYVMFTVSAYCVYHARDVLLDHS